MRERIRVSTFELGSGVGVRVRVRAGGQGELWTGLGLVIVGDSLGQS